MALDESAFGKSFEGLSKLLLGPVFLIHEIVAALFPGVLFFLLLLLKHRTWALEALQSPVFGYRTRILIFLFLCYVMGKVVRCPLEFVELTLIRRDLPKTEDTSKPSDPKNMFITMLSGAVLLPGLLGKARFFDQLVLIHTGIAFYTTTGLMLLLGASIPGDGNLRLIEGVAGLIMLLWGLRQTRAIGVAVIAFLGVSLADFVAKIPYSELPKILENVLSLFRVGLSAYSATQKAVKPPDASTTLPPNDKPGGPSQ